MSSIFSIIGGMIQLVFLILTNNFNKDAEDKKRKEDLHVQLTQAIKDRDTVLVTSLLDKLRT